MVLCHAPVYNHIFRECTLGGSQQNWRWSYFDPLPIATRAFWCSLRCWEITGVVLILFVFIELFPYAKAHPCLFWLYSAVCYLYDWWMVWWCHQKLLESLFSARRVVWTSRQVHEHQLGKTLKSIQKQHYLDMPLPYYSLKIVILIHSNRSGPSPKKNSKFFATIVSPSLLA